MKKRFLSQTDFSDTDYKTKSSKKIKRSNKIKYKNSKCKSSDGNIYNLMKQSYDNIIEIILRNEKKYPYIEHFSNLCKLYIKNCKFTIPDYIGYMLHLSVLTISNSTITNIAELLNSGTNLKKIILSNTIIPNIEKLPYNLRVLKIQTSTLEEIPDCVYKLYNLEELDISNNKITSISKKINAMYNLKYLDLHSNKITTIDVKFPNTLTNINLSFNDILTIDDNCFAYFSSLKYVNLSYNKLLKIPSSVFENKNIKYLDFSYNNISEFDEKILSFETLIYINLSYNSIDCEQIKEKIKNKPYIKLNFG